MKTNTIFKCLSAVALALAFGTACSELPKIDDYKQFIGDKEIQYAGKIKDVEVRSGKNRVGIEATLGSDPKVVTCRIFWNMRADSVEVAVDRSVSDKLYEIIELPENNYSFELVTYDADGNHSVPTTVTGVVYGSDYESSITNRLMVAARETEDIDGNMFTIVEWRPMDTTKGAYVTKLTYTNTEGTQVTIDVPVTDGTTNIFGRKSDTPISYVTLYKPDETCLDDFSSEAETREVDALEWKLIDLDKSKFSRLFLPGDLANPILPIEKIWDNIYDEAWTSRFVSNDSADPQWITIDLGTSCRLASMRHYNYGDDTYGLPRKHYTGGMMRKFEIWGSAKPDTDGSWDSWALLGSFEVIKPSGKPLYEETEEDRAKGLEGFLSEINDPLSKPRVRYIRIKLLENWSGSHNWDLHEIFLKGYVI